MTRATARCTEFLHTLELCPEVPIQPAPQQSDDMHMPQVHDLWPALVDRRDTGDQNESWTLAELDHSCSPEDAGGYWGWPLVLGCLCLGKC